MMTVPDRPPAGAFGTTPGASAARPSSRARRPRCGRGTGGWRGSTTPRAGTNGIAGLNIQSFWSPIPTATRSSRTGGMVPRQPGWPVRGCATSCERLAWLNEAVAIGVMSRTGDELLVHLYRVVALTEPVGRWIDRRPSEGRLPMTETGIDAVLFDLHNTTMDGSYASVAASVRVGDRAGWGVAEGTEQGRDGPLPLAGLLRHGRRVR